MTSHTLKLVSLIVFHIFHKIHVAKLKIFFAHPMDPLSQPSWKAPPLGSTGVLPSVLVNLASSWVTKKLATASIPSWALKSTVWMFEKVERRDWASPNLLSRLTNRTHSHLLQLNLISKISLPSTLSYRMKSPMSLWLIIHMGQEEKVEQAEGPKLSHQDSQLPIGFYVFSFHRGSPVATFLGKLISKYKRKGKKRWRTNLGFWLDIWKVKANLDGIMWDGVWRREAVPGRRLGKEGRAQMQRVRSLEFGICPLSTWPVLPSCRII